MDESGREWRRRGARVLGVLAIAAVHAVGLAWLMAPANQPLAITRPGRPMQLFWIPRSEPPTPDLADVGNTGPARTPHHPDRTFRAAILMPPARPAPFVSTGTSERPPESSPPAATAWNARTMRALLQQLPEVAEPTASTPAPASFSGGRQAIRLPDDGPPMVEGIAVSDGVSVDERVQGVLALVGLGRIDPCPDIRRHLRSAVAAGDPDEVSHWIHRERRCR